MLMLLLKKHLVQLVREGKKRQTIRVWSRPVVCAGQISYTPGLGKMLITRVDEITGFDELTDADAVADGFSNKSELLAELKRHYPHIPPGKRLFRIMFQWPLAVVDSDKPALQPVARMEKSGERTTNKKANVSQPVIRLAKNPDSSIAATHDAPAIPRDAMNQRQRTALRDFIQTRAKASGWIG